MSKIPRPLPSVLPAASTLEDYAKANLTPPTPEEKEADKNFEPEPVELSTASIPPHLASLLEWAIKMGFEALKQFIQQMVQFNPEPKFHAGDNVIYARVGSPIRICAENVDDECRIFMNNTFIGGLSEGETAQFLSPRVQKGLNNIVFELRNTGGTYGVNAYACRDGQKQWESKCYVYDQGHGGYNHIIVIQVYGQ